MLDVSMDGNDADADPSHPDPVSAALSALRAAAQELAARADTPAHAGAKLTAAIRQSEQGASAQELLAMYAAVDRARDAARMAAPPARYRWDQWSEVSRLARECLTAAVQGMRAQLDEQRVAGAPLRQEQHSVAEAW